jgi:hypothetical protein
MRLWGGDAAKRCSKDGVASIDGHIRHVDREEPLVDTGTALVGATASETGAG